MTDACNRPLAEPLARTLAVLHHISLRNGYPATCVEIASHLATSHQRVLTHVQGLRARGLLLPSPPRAVRTLRLSAAGLEAVQGVECPPAGAELLSGVEAAIATALRVTGVPVAIGVLHAEASRAATEAGAAVPTRHEVVRHAQRHGLQHSRAAQRCQTCGFRAYVVYRDEADRRPAICEHCATAEEVAS